MKEYITKQEYEDYAGKAPDNFKQLLVRASAELDSITRFFFKKNELDDSFVSQQFKYALMEQIKFYDDFGATSAEKLNSQPDSVRIGDTTVSYNRGVSGSNTKQRNSIVSRDALNMLSGTGLLYRGLS